ncbi:tyrosine-protein phosphatase [Allocatelliglobosispora scoriae]|uniref:tyrosine-protein phosphatase n=1 Tax=Allocatelliglobosispora scoriae TaxID=643052 RepID=UPI0016093147
MLAARPEYLDAAYSAAIARYGTFHAFISTALGVDTLTQRRLRDNLVTGSPSTRHHGAAAHPDQGD